MHETVFTFSATALPDPRAARRLRHGWAALAACVALVCAAADVAGQTPVVADPTRQSEWADRQADKASALHQDEPSGLERAIARMNAAFISERPMHLFVGGVLDGGGLALGPGYRTRFGDSGAFRAHAAWSWKGQKGAAAALDLPAMAGGRLRPSVSASWIDAPDMRAYGPGSASSNPGDLAFRYRRSGAGAGMRVQPWQPMSLGGELGVLSISTASAAIGGHQVAPGLRLDRTYARSRLFAEVDTRGSQRYSAAGGRYRVDFTDHRGQGRNDFQQLEAEVQQYLPILRNNWTLALRGLVTTTATPAGHDVPYVLLPSLGGQALRGYDAWRFRDRARVLVSGEYRWAAGPHLDVAAFVDAGTVAPRLSDVTARGLKTTHGVGLIVHTPRAALARIDLARSRDGLAIHLSVGPTF